MYAVHRGFARAAAIAVLTFAAAGVLAQDTTRETARQGGITVRANRMMLDLGSGVKMELVLIRPGSFIMGDDRGGEDERPAHKVTITKPFYLGKYEVTQEQWKSLMGSNPSAFQGPKNPVEHVSPVDCQAFIKKLNEKFGRRGAKFSLPTEAQWEYACRAGSRDKYCFGDDERRWANTPGLPTTRTPRRIRWAKRSRTPGASTTCTATCRNGAPITTTRITTRRRLPTTRIPLPATSSRAAAAIGTTRPPNVAPAIVTSRSPVTVLNWLVFG